MRLDLVEREKLLNKNSQTNAKPVKRWAASVAIASELDRIPPTISPIIKTRHSIEANISFFRALNIDVNKKWVVIKNILLFIDSFFPILMTMY